MERPQFPALSLTRTNDSSTSTPPSSFIANLPPSPRSSSPAGRVPTTPTSSRPPSQLRPRDSRPPYLPFRRISLPSTPGPGYAHKRDSIASVFSVDSVQEHDDEAQDGKGVVSASLPTESSMPDMGTTAPPPISGSLASLNTPLPPPPPIPASRTPLSSSPSRRVVILAPPGGGAGASGTPSRVRPRPLSTHSLARMSNRSPARTNQSPGKSIKSARRPAAIRLVPGEKEKEREEKRRKIAKELLDTEQSYVDGLDLVENHFLAPLIESLTTPQPLVTPADLSLIFPGFIDILNFSRSFLGELRGVLEPGTQTASAPVPVSSSASSGPIPIPSSASSRPIPFPMPSSTSTSLGGRSFPNEEGTSGSAPSTSRLRLTSESQASLHSHVYVDLSASAIQEGVEPTSATESEGPGPEQEFGQEPEPEPEPEALLPSLASVLAQHVPYLKLYKPFVTAFPASMERLAKLSANERFRLWLRDKERDPACGMLGLRSWLLSVVQRCPRYLLLVKDLVKHTDENDEGYQELSDVLALLTKITSALNTSLADHTAVLALLDLQRNTTSLPPGFSYVAPGRSLVRRGRLRMSGQEISQDGMRREVMRRVGGWDESHGEREFLLFSDCVVWLERELDWGLVSASGAGGWSSAVGGGGARNSAASGGGARQSAASGVGLGRPTEALRRPTMGRTRSKSEAQLPTLRSQGSDLSSTPEGQRAVSGSSSAFVGGREADRRPMGERDLRPVEGAPPRRSVGTLEQSTSSEEKWRFRGMANLMDVEVVISPRNAVQIDFLSPEGSFALYASTYDEREEWISAIRSSKATILATFNVTHPDSTLTSSSSTTHLRRVLQALPYPPGEATIRGARNQGTARKSILGKSRIRERQAAVAEDTEDADAEESSSATTAPTRSAFAKQSGKETKQKERRGRVEHYVPAIWVPDREASVCMRCQAAFGWRRRRHHCRLCGRVVCANCSSKNFFVMDPANADSSKSRKPERACSLCYETVFPVIRSSNDSLDTSRDRVATIMPQRHSARPRTLQHLISTSPVTTPAVERPLGFSGPSASPSTATMLTPSSTAPMGTSPSRATIPSSPSSRSDARLGDVSEPAEMITSSTTARTITSLDSQRTLQPPISMASDLSSLTSTSQSSRPRSLDVGRHFAAASAFVHTAGVTARSKVIGKGKGRRVSLISGRRAGGGEPVSNGNPGESVATLGRGAAAQQLSELLGRSPK